MRWGKSVTIVGVLALFVMIWADLRETQREVRHLADRLDAQIALPAPQQPTPSPPAATYPAKSDWESSPPYVIEAPDILMIDQTNVIPLPSYQVEPFDVLHAAGKHVLEADPINGVFAVRPDGTIDLGALAAAGGVRDQGQIKVWVARPVGGGPDRILPVRCADIVHGDASTNHQLRPGDRVFVARDE